ncbi:MAG: hypothetical protein ACK53L_25610, partial [Pirellulaceae bacterium]
MPKVLAAARRATRRGSACFVYRKQATDAETRLKPPAPQQWILRLIRHLSPTSYRKAAMTAESQRALENRIHPYPFTPRLPARKKTEPNSLSL